MEWKYAERDMEKRASPIGIQFPPPPLPHFEFPDSTESSSEKLDPAWRGFEAGLLAMTCYSDPVEVAPSGRDWVSSSGDSNSRKLAMQSVHVFASSGDSLIPEWSGFRQLEAIDLAINRVNKHRPWQIQQSSNCFGCNRDMVATSRTGNNHFVATRSALPMLLRGHLSPPLVKSDRCLYFQGQIPGKSFQSKGVPCSYGEFPRVVITRDLRRGKMVNRMPIIKEIEKASSGEEEDDPISDSTKVQSNTTSHESVMQAQKLVASKGGSLLDVMHKKYCPNQYNKSQSEQIRLRTASPSNTIDTNSPNLSGQTWTTPCKDITSDPGKVRHNNPSPSAIKSVDCTSDKRTGRNLTLLLSPSSVCLSSSQSSPLSPHSVSSATRSPLVSPNGWRDEDTLSADDISTGQTNDDQWTEELQTGDQETLFGSANPMQVEGESPATDSEVEAVEACEWLRDAGFPQYVQMYKDNQFPIDLKAAEKDHEFLDEDALQALFRRLDVLNKCSSSRLKRSPAKKNVYESDDEYECALSSKWTFQRNSRLWSRNEVELIPHLTIQPDSSVNGRLHSTSSRDSLFDDILERQSCVLPSDGSKSDAASSIPVCLNAVPMCPSVSNQDFSQSETAEASKSSKLKRPSLFLSPFSTSVDNQDEFVSKKTPSPESNRSKNDVLGSTSKLKLSVDTCHQDSLIQNRKSSDSSNVIPSSPSSASVDIQKITGDRFWGALGIFRKIEGLKLRRSTRKSSKSELTKKDIGSPVLVESPEVLMKIDSLQCTDINPIADTAIDLVKTDADHILDEQKTVREDSLAIQTPFLHPSYIPQTTEMRLKHDVGMPSIETQTIEDSGQSNISNLNSQTVVDEVKFSSTSDINRLDGRSKELEDAVEIIAELLHSVNLEMPSAPTNSKKRISIYDNVSSEVCSVLQNELDALLSELYKNIDSLDYSMSKVASNLKVGSPASSVVTLDEEDTAKTSAVVLPSNHLAAKESLARCDSTDGNSSTTPSEGSYNLESAAAKHESTIQKFLKDSSAGENITDNLVQTVEDGNHVVPLSVEAPSDPDSDDSPEQTNTDWSYPNRGGTRERRDSGVGSSLTRTASSGKRQKRARLRWHSFAKSHQVVQNSCDQPISYLSAGQLAVLRKLSLLKVTAALEKYSPVNRNNWSWFVPRLRRRSKMPDYSEKNIFGIPISLTQQRYGQALPQCILYAMRRLRRTAGDSIGIFRKPGVRMRVQTLRIALESDPDVNDFEGMHAYDVADLLKLYFRELPECLLTNKLSNVFISIFLYIPEDLRCDLIRSTLLLLPDEHRLVLQSLLLFLNDMALHSQLNQMNASNLAVCFAPSLFNLCSAKSSSSSSPKQLQKRGPVPLEKDLVEQKVAHECLTYMINNAKSIFTVSEEMLSMCPLSYLEQGCPVPLEELCRKFGKCDGGNYSTYVDSCIQGLLKESREKFKGWIAHSSSRSDVDLAYKKVGDGHPLRLWKFCVKVEAPPEEVLSRVMKERHLWDEDVLKWRTVEKLDSQTEVFQYVLNSMAPHPTQDFSELRSWRTNLSRGMCVMISTSVEHANAPLMGDVRGVVLASRYLIEPCGSGKSRLTHVIRIDLRGHNPDWYNNVYGHICASYARRIRDSFKTSIDLTAGPETKV